MATYEGDVGNGQGQKGVLAKALHVHSVLLYSCIIMIWGPVTSGTLKQVVVMATFYLSLSQSPHFFTLTWVKKSSQYFNFYQSLKQ